MPLLFFSAEEPQPWPLERTLNLCFPMCVYPDDGSDWTAAPRLPGTRTYHAREPSVGMQIPLSWLRASPRSHPGSPFHFLGMRLIPPSIPALTGV